MVKYSIIVPVYNLEHYIVNTLEAICENDLSESEIIVVNDGSMDNSAQVVNDFLAQKKVKFSVVEQENKGVSAARNAGIQVACGEYIIFIDGDDKCSSDMIEKIGEYTTDLIVWRFFSENNGRLTVSQKEFEKNEYSNISFLKSLIDNENRIRIGSFAVKRELLIRYGLEYVEGCAVGEDVEFIYKAVLMSDSITTLNSELYIYNKREGSAANVLDLKRFQAPIAMRRFYDYACAAKKLDDVMLEDIKYGLYITHTMYAFDACCRYIKDNKQRKELLDSYYDTCRDIEKNIIEAKRNMKKYPKMHSRKRIVLFLFSRRLYVWKMCSGR